MGLHEFWSMNEMRIGIVSFGISSKYKEGDSSRGRFLFVDLRGWAPHMHISEEY